VDSNLKKCVGRCKGIKSLDEFTLIRRGSTERKAQCKACLSQVKREQRARAKIPYVRPQIVLSEAAMIINNATRVIHESKAAEMRRM